MNTEDLGVIAVEQPVAKSGNGGIIAAAVGTGIFVIAGGLGYFFGGKKSDKKKEEEISSLQTQVDNLTKLVDQVDANVKGAKETK